MLKRFKFFNIPNIPLLLGYLGRRLIKERTEVMMWLKGLHVHLQTWTEHDWFLDRKSKRRKGRTEGRTEARKEKSKRARDRNPQG